MNHVPSCSIFNKKDATWYREVQPLLNTVIRRQLLEVFSRGVELTIKKSGIDNTEKIFNSEDGVYRSVLTDESFYKGSNVVDLEASLAGPVGEGERGARS